MITLRCISEFSQWWPPYYIEKFTGLPPASTSPYWFDYHLHECNSKFTWSRLVSVSLSILDHSFQVGTMMASEYINMCIWSLLPWLHNYSLPVHGKVDSNIVAWYVIKSHLCNIWSQNDCKYIYTVIYMNNIYCNKPVEMIELITSRF